VTRRAEQLRRPATGAPGDRGGGREAPAAGEPPQAAATSAAAAGGTLRISG
jgi:hypothetical protein